jgi:xanthine dehydrogenase YagS FAD-binding subunit
VELLQPSSVEEAAAALGNGSRALAGGTELVPLMRDGLVRVETLVQVSRVVPRGINLETVRRGQTEVSPLAGVVIGAGTTLAELEANAELPHVLREACTQAASPQLRAMGSVGGNLLQATRCWYWRLGFDCWLHGGQRCFAKDGAHREHAIFGSERCASAHPSDVAAALLALNATVRTSKRELPVADLYRLPTGDDRSITTLAPDELILELDVPQADASTYLKAMDRKKWSFPIVGVAAARFGETVRIALAGVAPIPWALDSAAALEDATPLPGTAYKVEIARALVRRAVEGLGALSH